MFKDDEWEIVEEIMTKDLITIHQLDTLEKAIELMINYNIKKLPVTKDEHIIGIITVTDISKARPDLSERFMSSWVKPEWMD